MISFPSKQSLGNYFAGIYQYRGLLVLMSKKWVKAKYEDSYIGLGWMVASPIITTIVYTLFFSIMFNMQSNKVQYFLFIYSGMLPWVFFRDVFIETLDVFPKESLMIKRTNFPRLIIPLSVVLNKLLQFGVGIAILFIIALLSGKDIGAHFFLFPILMLQIVLIALGFGLVFIIPSIIYRDVKHLIKFIVPLGLYSLPIFYKISAVPTQWLSIYTLNPMVSFMQSFRAILFKQTIPWYLLGKGMVISFVVFIIGLAIFRRYEKRLPDFI
jgi:ABC-type polysaccharide/polyol phosphate export permease